MPVWWLAAMTGSTLCDISPLGPLCPIALGLQGPSTGGLCQLVILAGSQVALSPLTASMPAEWVASLTVFTPDGLWPWPLRLGLRPAVA